MSASGAHLPPLHKLVSEVLYEKGILSVKFKSLAGRVVYFRPFIQRKTSTGSRLVERVLFVVGSSGELVIADVDANPKRAVSLARVTSVLVDGSTLTLLFEGGSAEHDVQVKFAPPPPGIEDSRVSPHRNTRVTFVDDLRETQGQQQQPQQQQTEEVPLQTLRQFLHVLKHYSPNAQIIHGSSSAIDIRLDKPSHFEEPKVDMQLFSSSPSSASDPPAGPPNAATPPASASPSSLSPPPPPSRTPTKVMMQPLAEPSTEPTGSSEPTDAPKHHDDDHDDLEGSHREAKLATFRQLTQPRQHVSHAREHGNREGEDSLASDFSPSRPATRIDLTLADTRSTNARDEDATDHLGAERPTSGGNATDSAVVVGHDVIDAQDAGGHGDDDGEHVPTGSADHDRRAPRVASLDRLARLSERSEQLSAKLTAAPPAELLFSDAALGGQQPLLSDMVRKLRAKRAEVQMHNMMLEGEIRGLLQRTQRLMDSHQRENPMPEFDFAPVHASSAPTATTRGRRIAAAAAASRYDDGVLGIRDGFEEEQQVDGLLDSSRPVMTATRQYHRTMNMALLILSICRRQRQIHLHAERDARERQRAAERRHRGSFGNAMFVDASSLSRIHDRGGTSLASGDPSADMRSLLSMSFVH